MLQSFLANSITNFLEEKRALGYSYKTDEQRLINFDKFVIDKYPEVSTLTQDIIMAWVDRDNVIGSTISRDLTIVNELARFMIRQGNSAAVIPYHKYPRYTRNFRARILTEAEIQLLLDSADSYPVNYVYDDLHHEISCLFHLLINAGFRISELLNMKLNEVNRDDAILTVPHGKNQIPRNVPLSDGMAERLREYIKMAHPVFNKEHFLFPGTRSEKLRATVVHKYFRNLLRMANIPYCGKNNGPRLHDLRHTFAVNCLNAWVRNDIDLNTALPILSKFMGHINIKGTQKYLQFTAEMYPDLIEKMNVAFGNIIAKGDDGHENN